MLCIHGWALSCDKCECRTARPNQVKLRRIAYDQRSLWSLSQPCGGYDFDTFADDPAAVIEELDLCEVTLVGQ